MSLPLVLVPGLNCSARIFANQVPALWQYGPVMIANHRGGDSMESIASAILAAAPPRFALAGFSMGGYVVFEMLRQARERVVKLALLDTGARADTEQHIKIRRQRIAATEAGRFSEELDNQFPFLVHNSRRDNTQFKQAYRQMAEECGAETFIRHLKATMERPDSRPELARIDCPTLVMVGDSDRVTPPELAVEMAENIRNANLVVIPECGHLSLLEKPQEVTHALIAWMNL